MAERVERKLAAILAADVAGYSRLMGQDEERTMRALAAHRRELSDTKITEHHGRIANTAGDSLLVEFASVVDAVRCAVDIQRGMAERNASVPEDQRLVFRMGINVGDVMVQGTDLMGDGVNVAARLEQIAEPGGIYVSRSVREQVGERLPLAYEDLGPQRVKNIAKPVDVWRVRWEREPRDRTIAPAQAAAVSSQTGITPPSLAVLPFQNMSSDPEQEYFSDGLTEDLITDLSRFSRLSVVARNTVFTYKGRPVNIPRMGEELGVRYVLEGSVRKSGERVRLNAQLIDVATGRHLWAQRYDRELKDLFDLQDEISRSIVSELEVHILEGEQARSWQAGTRNPQALDLFRRARAAAFSSVDSLPVMLEALGMFRQVVALDPEFARAHASVALAGVYALGLGLASGQLEFLQAAREAAERALSLDPSLPEAWGAKGFCLMFEGMGPAALAAAERSIDLGPRRADVLARSTIIHLFAGRPEEALQFARRAESEGSEVNPSTVQIHVGLVLVVLDRYQEAVAVLEPIVNARLGSSWAIISLAAAYAALGRMPEAMEQGRNLMRLLNGVPFDGLARWVLPFVDPASRERIVALVRRSGVK